MKRWRKDREKNLPGFPKIISLLGFQNSLPNFRDNFTRIQKLVSTIYVDSREQAPFRIIIIKSVHHFFMGGYGRFESSFNVAFHVGCHRFRMDCYSRLMDCYRIHMGCYMFGLLKVLCRKLNLLCTLLQPLCGLSQSPCGLSHTTL